jgi:hypothetical protein
MLVFILPFFNSLALWTRMGQHLISRQGPLPADVITRSVFDVALLAEVPMDRLDDVVPMSLDRVVTELTPWCLHQWMLLRRAICDGSASIALLRATFSRLPKENMIREIELLLSTAGPDPTCTAVPTVLSVDSRLEDFLFMENMLRFLPALVRLRTLLDALFIPQLSDSRFEEVVQLQADQTIGWETQTLTTVTRSAAPIKVLLQGLSTEQLDFLLLLSNSEAAFISFLLAQNDTTTFNNMREVCRATTNEHHHEAAMAALVNVRTLLLNILYSHRYAGLGNFLDEFRKISITRQSSDELEQIQQSFAPLLEVIRTQTRSPGVRAFYDLIDLEEKNGIFVVRAGSNRSACVHVKLLSSNKNFDFENLMELRSMAMMNTVPEKLEVKGVAELVLSYAAQLEEVIAIFELIQQLHELGHYGFQSSVHEFRFTRTGLSQLRLAREQIKTTVVEWEQLVQVLV